MKSTVSDRRSNGRTLAIEPLEARHLLAVDFELLKDVNQVPSSRNWTQAVEVGSRSYLVAGSTTLWSTDGTSAGTFLVHEAASTIRDLTNVNGTLFFAADARFTPNGVELWKSDGTPAGTTLVKDIVPNDPNVSSTAAPRYLTNVNGTLFFRAYGDGAVGNELWKSDGSESGTVLVKDIHAGSGGSYPRLLTNVNGTLCFKSGDDERIWRSDGTAAGTFAGDATQLLYNVNYLTNVGGTLYFAGSREGIGQELWKFDATTATTSLVADIAPGSASSGLHDFVSFGGNLFFIANDGVHGPELWRSNGTAAGTTMVKDVFAATNDSEHIQELTVVGETLFFHAREGAGDRRLWKSDGTTAGTIPVSLEPLGAPGGFLIASAPMIEAGGKLYFRAYEPSSGEEIWSSDGTLAGTRLAYDVTPGPTSTPSRFLTEFDDTLLFTSSTGTLWKGDEQGTGATIVSIPTNKTGSSVQVNDLFTSMGGITFFTADDGIHGRELWRTDGTEAGTWLVKDVTPGSAGSTLKHFTVVGNLLYFTNEDFYLDAELWKSDGTTAGTTLLTTLARTGHNPPRELVNVNGTLFFNADTPLVSTGVELWKSDGTVAGTKAITDMIPTGSTARVAHLSNVNGTLLFRGYQEATGSELWRSDGTESGTTLVKDIDPGSSGGLVGGSLDELPRVVADGVLYFRAGYYTDKELWRSDGTANGTYLVKDIYAGSRSSELNNFCVVNNRIYFSARYANSSGSSDYLWTTDGTTAGTVVLYTWPQGPARPRDLTNVDGTLFFTAGEVNEGRSLWKSDGTKAGTMLVKDIRAGDVGFSSDEFSRLTNFGGTLYFTANDGVHGRELWRSDGTAAGTVMVRDFVAGAWSGSTPLFVANGRLLLATSAEPYGNELWISTPERQGPADYDENGRVDGSDFLAWQRAYGATVDPVGSGADGDGNGTVGSEDLGVWQAAFGGGGSTAVAASSASEFVAAALIAEEELAAFVVDDGEQSDVGSAADAAFAWLAGDRAATDRGGWQRSARETELLARDWAARSIPLAATAGSDLRNSWRIGGLVRRLQAETLAPEDRIERDGAARDDLPASALGRAFD